MPHSIFIYSPYWSTYGGGEKYTAALAAALARLPDVSVTLLSTEESVTRERLEDYFGLSLGGVALRYLHGGSAEVSQRSSEADMFVSLSNFRHIPSRARTRVLLLQVPYPAITTRRIVRKLVRGEVREALKDLLRRRLLAEARSGYQRVIVNSRFVHEVLLRHHGITSVVLHPPIQDFQLRGIPKQNIILSVGRFFAGLYNEKRYDILLQAFRHLCTEVSGWEYHIAGSAPADRQSQKFLDELRRAAAGLPVHFHINATFSEIHHLYNRAKLFWHGAGYGVDESETPERLEHFGMTTVEAMSAGCIPLVVPRGGPREIVEPGVNGFVWNSIEELLTQTRAIIEGRVDVPALSSAARRRSQEFSVEHFTATAQSLFAPLLV